MNRYGQLARQHWMRWLPSRYAGLSDPQGFFTGLGEQVQAAIVDVEQGLEARADLAGLDYLDRLGRLNAIRAQARELVLTEMVYLAAEESDEGWEEPAHPLAAWMDPAGMPLDRDHPLWAMSEDPQVSVQEFAAASAAWEDSLWQQLQVERDPSGG